MHTHGLAQNHYKYIDIIDFNKLTSSTNCHFENLYLFTRVASLRGGIRFKLVVTLHGCQMHCEFCDKYLQDVADARRHLLSASHMRHRREYDLNKTKFVEKMKQAAIRPKNMVELNQLLNIRSTDDVDAMDSENFFRINTLPESKIARELIRILFDNINDYYVGALPPSLRITLRRDWDEEKRKYK